jgi:PAS domain S-box-containing protein
MKRQRQVRSMAIRYGLAVGAVAAAFVVTMLVPTLRHRESFVLFFAAIFVTAWYGGRGPGLAACVITGFLWDYFVFEPAGVFSIGADAIIPLVVFLLVVLLTGSFTTNLALAEESAREQREWLQVTLSSIGDGVIATDATAKITFMNSVAEALTGWSSRDAHGKSIDDVFIVTGRTGLIARALRNSETVTLVDAAIAHQQGTPVPIEGNAAPIRNSEREVIGAVLVFRGIAEREEARRKILLYQERLRKMATEVSLAEERQRRTIADGLHDRIGQTLALARIKCGTLREHCADANLRNQIDEIVPLLKQLVSEIRSMTFELSPPILYEFGLQAALEWLANSMQTQHHLDCSFQSSGDAKPFRQQTDVVLFQAARELLTNVVKHAQTHEALVSIQTGEKDVCVKIEDKGAGFDTSSGGIPTKQAGGFGLFSIRERIQHLGGTVEIKSDPGHGTCISLTLPVTV